MPSLWARHIERALITMLSHSPNFLAIEPILDVSPLRITRLAFIDEFIQPPVASNRPIPP